MNIHDPDNKIEDAEFEKTWKWLKWIIAPMAVVLGLGSPVLLVFGIIWVVRGDYNGAVAILVALGCIYTMYFHRFKDKVDKEGD